MAVVAQVGEAGCEVKQCSPRAWSVRLTAPADWAVRVQPLGLYQRRRLRGLPPVPAIVLDYSDSPAGRLLTLVERPQSNRNTWRIYRVTVPLPTVTPSL